MELYFQENTISNRKQVVKKRPTNLKQNQHGQVLNSKLTEREPFL